MSTNNESGLVFLQEIEKKNLIADLIRQLNKDLQLAGLDFELEEKALAEEIIAKLQSFLLHIITNDFRAYLNFLYRVDLSEKKIKALRETNPEKIAQAVTQMVLEREWYKVWIKSKNL